MTEIFNTQYEKADFDYCKNCESAMEFAWNYCSYCGKKRDNKLATKLGGEQPESVKQKISKSIKEWWAMRNNGENTV